MTVPEPPRDTAVPRESRLVLWPALCRHREATLTVRPPVSRSAGSVLQVRNRVGAVTSVLLRLLEGPITGRVHMSPPDTHTLFVGTAIPESG